MKRYTLLAVFALLLAFGVVGRASAHAEIVSSTPAAGARLSSAPATVTIVYSEEISETESSFSVTNAGGATVGAGKLDLNDLDRKTLTGTLNSGLGNGVYTVRWKTVTPDDNGVTEGTFTFGVNADPGAQPTAAPHNDDDAAATVAPAAATSAPAPTARPAATVAAAVAATSAPATTAVAGGTTLPSTGVEGTGIEPAPLLAILVVATLVIAGGILLRRRGTR